MSSCLCFVSSLANSHYPHSVRIYQPAPAKTDDCLTLFSPLSHSNTFNFHDGSTIQLSQATAIPCCYSVRVLSNRSHIVYASANQLRQTIQHTTTENFKPTMSGPSTTAPINTTDAMFDRIVTAERKIGLTIDLHHSENPSIKPINGRLLQASDQYKKAMQRRLARLFSDRPGRERLHWESESFAMNVRTTEAGTKNVRYIAMYIPITENELCDCWCGRRDYECVRFRKELSMVFIFDHQPIDLAQTKTYLSKQENGRVVLNHELDGAGGFAWLRAHCLIQEINWTWSGANVLDLNAVWLHVHEALIPIFAETSRICQEKRRAARTQAAEAPPARRTTRGPLPRVVSQDRIVATQALIDDSTFDRCVHGHRVAFVNGVIVGCEDCRDREEQISRRDQAPAAHDASDGVTSQHSDLPSPPLTGNDDTAAAESLMPLDATPRPCVHGHNHGSCEDCGDRS